MHRQALLVVLVGTFLVVGCGDDGAGSPSSLKAPLGTAEVEQAGTYTAGVTTQTFIDTSRPTMANGSYAGAPTRTLNTEIWYPAEGTPSMPLVEVRDAVPAKRGRLFPLIVYSHGFMSNRYGGGYLARHLASHGYVVISPDYPLTFSNAPGKPTVLDLANQPGDLHFLIDRMLELNADASSPFAGSIDAQRIGLTGLSLGGGTTFLATFHPTLRDTRIRAAAPMAGVACNFNEVFYGDRSIPLLLVHGDIDAIVNYQAHAVRAFALANRPKYLVTLVGGSHTGFTDGIEQIAEAANNPDDLGCGALVGTLPSDPQAGQAFLDSLGGAAAGVVDNHCPAACPVRRNPRSMRPSRQHELTILSIFPFFEAELRGDARAREYLEATLPKENADVLLEKNP
jgi:predicted dienelactone hydrolase